MNKNYDEQTTVKIYLPVNEVFSFQSKIPPKIYWLTHPGYSNGIVEMDIPMRILKEWNKQGSKKQMLYD